MANYHFFVIDHYFLAGCGNRRLVRVWQLSFPFRSLLARRCRRMRFGGGGGAYILCNVGFHRIRNWRYLTFCAISCAHFTQTRRPTERARLVVCEDDDDYQ